MSFAEFLSLPDDARAEYVDGVAIVSPPPGFGHQKVVQRLVSIFEAAFGGDLEVVAGAGWRLPGARERVRIPDVMVLARQPSGELVTEVPLTIVEVLSSNRSDDLVRKSTEYLAAGVGQYWIVDRGDRVVDVFERGETGWVPLARLDAAHPGAELSVAGHTTGWLDLDAILGPP